MLPQSVGVVSAAGLLCATNVHGVYFTQLRRRRSQYRAGTRMATVARRCSMLGHHVFARRRGLPSLSYRLGQISWGATPIASVSRSSIAGQGCFSAFPAAVG